jgi:hypothetical protein
LIFRRRGAESQGFTLGWVPSALQAEARGAEQRGAGRPGSQGFTLGWVPSALQAEARGAEQRGAGRPGSQGFTVGWIPAALQAAQSWWFWGLRSYPRVSPWAEFLRPFRPPHFGVLRGLKPLGEWSDEAYARTKPSRPVRPTAAGRLVDEFLPVA